MNIEDIKNKKYSKLDIKEDFKDVDNESIELFSECLKDLVFERERKNLSWFIGWRKVECGDVAYDIIYKSLGNRTEARAQSWVDSVSDDPDCIDAGYIEVNEDLDEKYNILFVINNANSEVNNPYLKKRDSIPGYIKEALDKYDGELREELGIEKYALLEL